MNVPAIYCSGKLQTGLFVFRQKNVKLKNHPLPSANKRKATCGIKTQSETRAETVRYTEKKEIMSKLVKTQKEIAKEYGVCRSTFRKWLKPIEKKLRLTRRPLLMWQVEMIYEFLDKPEPEA